MKKIIIFIYSLIVCYILSYLIIFPIIWLTSQHEFAEYFILPLMYALSGLLLLPGIIFSLLIYNKKAVIIVPLTSMFLSLLLIGWTLFTLRNCSGETCMAILGVYIGGPLSIVISVIGGLFIGILIDKIKLTDKLPWRLFALIVIMAIVVNTSIVFIGGGCPPKNDQCLANRAIKSNNYKLCEDGNVPLNCYKYIAVQLENNDLCSSFFDESEIKYYPKSTEIIPKEQIQTKKEECLRSITYKKTRDVGNSNQIP